MYHFRGPIFTILALIAACGGKVIVDSNGGGDQGGGSTGFSGTVSVGGSDFGTTGTGFAGAYAAGSAGPFGAGGVIYAGGYFGSGGVSTTTGGGGFFPCGPTLCPVGQQCCSPQCGLCVPQGAPCPAIVCGAGGSFGSAGSFGAGGGCGSPASCQARLPGTPYCPGEAACLCNSCACPATTCLNDPGCQQILQCALKLNCRGMACYTPQACQGVIDQYGVNSPSMFFALQLDQCRSNSGCDGRCGGAVDAGIACPQLPPSNGVMNCSGGGVQGDCYEQCSDSQMNTFGAKCVGSSCSCTYNGKPICSCPMGAPGTCGGCCPGFR